MVDFNSHYYFNLVWWFVLLDFQSHSSSELLGRDQTFLYTLSELHESIPFMLNVKIGQLIPYISKSLILESNNCLFKVWHQIFSARWISHLSHHLLESSSLTIDYDMGCLLTRELNQKKNPIFTSTFILIFHFHSVELSAVESVR